GPGGRAGTQRPRAGVGRPGRLALQFAPRQPACRPVPRRRAPARRGGEVPAGLARARTARCRGRVRQRRFHAARARQSRRRRDARAGGGAGALRTGDAGGERASPRRPGLEETVDSLSARGPVAATFAMSLPLGGAGGGPTIAGEVDLAGVALADARWKIGFENVRGQARYDQHGFEDKGLTAVREG